MTTSTNVVMRFYLGTPGTPARPMRKSQWRGSPFLARSSPTKLSPIAHAPSNIPYPMETKVFTYESDDVTITWDQKRCIHAAACVQGLPAVFDPDRRPWIDPAPADADAIEDVVQRCPTGALHMQRGGTDPETAPEANRIALFPNGPLLVRGDVELVDSDGAVLLRDTRLALCRCGLSDNKPLCDGSHDGAFDDPGVLQAERLSGDADGADDPLRIQAAADGPLLVEGPVTIEATDETTCAGRKGALCRCGASDAKPFCDGSHNDVAFTSA